MNGAEGRRLADALDGLTHALWTNESAEASLAWLTKAAVAAVPGAEAAGVTLRDRKGALDSVAVTDDFVTKVDAAQYRFGEGPCIASLQHGPIHLANDLSAEPRWPSFAPAAVAMGVGGMLSAHMFDRDGMAGSLNFYADRPGAFAAGAESTGLMYASQLAMAFAVCRQTTLVRDALTSRAEVGAALGILMERHHLDKEQAFSLLRKRFQSRNVKLREVARQIVRVRQDTHLSDLDVDS